jgi:hypothetical protein
MTDIADSDQVQRAKSLLLDRHEKLSVLFDTAISTTCDEELLSYIIRSFTTETFRIRRFLAQLEKDGNVDAILLEMLNG